jgi:hypothetical protein
VVTFPRLAGALVLLAVALAPGASAQTSYPPCPAGTPTPTFTVNGKTAPVYTSHDLVVRAKQPGDPNFSTMSFEVSGVRLLPNEDETQNPIAAVADSPGTLGATATLLTETSDGSSCTVSGTGSFEVRAATTPEVSKLRRPRVYKPDPKLTWDSEFRFTVKPGPTGDRRPLTVEARGIPRAKIPGRGVKPGKRTFAMRASDAAAFERDDRVLGTCSTSTIVCPKRIATWPTGPEINVYDRGGRVVPAAVEVHVTLPRGYPASRRSLRHVLSPAGVDVKVLQGGHTIARLRIAGLCDGRGQYSLCRFKKLTTAL